MLINDAQREFSDMQINKLIECIKDINSRHNHQMEVLGLGEVALDRHVAPGPPFPWENLAEAGIGKYFDTTSMNRDCKFSKGDKSEEVKRFKESLQNYGYRVTGKETKETKIEVTDTYDELTSKVINLFGSRYGVERDCWSERSEYVINPLNDAKKSEHTIDPANN